MSDQDRNYAAENLYHYANDGKVRIQYSNRLIDDNPIFESCDFTAYYYGSLLYDISRDFYPGFDVEDRKPSLKYLVKTSAEQSGTMVMIPPNADTLHTKFPSTYLGGNPFICYNSDENNDSGFIDSCATGTPTWPIWVPAPEKVAFIEGNLTQEKIDNYHDALKAIFPEKSERVALIYLGWALHFLGDLGQPDHANNASGTLHQNFEKYADVFIKYAKYTQDDFEDVSMLTHDEMCEMYDVTEKDDIIDQFYSIAEFSKNYYLDTNRRIIDCMLDEDCDQYDPVYDAETGEEIPNVEAEFGKTWGPITDNTLNKLIKEAIKKTMVLLACYSENKFYNELKVYSDNIRFSGDVIFHNMPPL